MEPAAFDRLMMQRCLDIAIRGRGFVSPNPLVGCVIVHQGWIIGEGYHKKYKGWHAEIEAIQSVAPADRSLISKSTVYVSLEPCYHHGHNPPCVDELIRQKVLRVVIGHLDPNPLVNGKSIAKLQTAGISVTTGVLAKEGRDFLNPFFCYQQNHRPYIILKWAESADGQLGIKHQSISISNGISKIISHKWRTELDAILVGYGTAHTDHPLLTARYYPGRAPLRVVLDPYAQLKAGESPLDGLYPTLIFNHVGKKSAEFNIEHVSAGHEKTYLPDIIHDLYSRKITSLLVEGGSSTLQSFLDLGLWDEIWQVVSPHPLRTYTLPAPFFKGEKIDEITCGTDKINRYKAFAR